MEKTANDETKWVFVSFGSEERGRRAIQNNLVYPGGAEKRQTHLRVPFK